MGNPLDDPDDSLSSYGSDLPFFQPPAPKPVDQVTSSITYIHSCMRHIVCLPIAIVALINHLCVIIVTIGR